MFMVWSLFILKMKEHHANVLNLSHDQISYEHYDHGMTLSFELTTNSVT